MRIEPLNTTRTTVSWSILARCCCLQMSTAVTVPHVSHDPGHACTATLDALRHSASPAADYTDVIQLFRNQTWHYQIKHELLAGNLFKPVQCLFTNETSSGRKVHHSHRGLNELDVSWDWKKLGKRHFESIIFNQTTVNIHDRTPGQNAEKNVEITMLIIPVHQSFSGYHWEHTNRLMFYNLRALRYV